jgi:hypothetical protein
VVEQCGPWCALILPSHNAQCIPWAPQSLTLHDVAVACTVVVMLQCIGLRFPGEANRDRLIELSIESGRMTQYRHQLSLTLPCQSSHSD